MKQAITVKGPVDPSELGVTLMHEHLFINLHCWLAEPLTPAQAEAADQPIVLSNLGVIRREPMISRDNLVLDDLPMIVDEVLAFKRAGGGTLVEVTPIGIKRDPLRMKQVSDVTGIHVICGCGYYVAPSHPPHVAEWTKEEIAAEMVRDLTRGIGDTGIRAGIIGEVGLSPGIHPDEAKVLRAAARASRETGAAITIHTPWPQGQKQEVLDILQNEGADLTRVIMGHIDWDLDPDLLQAITDRGAYIQFDSFGQEFYREAYHMHDPLDLDRVNAIAEMIRRGYIPQILLSQDVATKIDLRHYGGWGYAHISENIEPWMRATGITSEEIHIMRVENPKRVLPF